jgi:hypothetical protein
MMHVIRTMVVGTMCTTFAIPLAAQKTVTRPGQTVSATATIQELDVARRFVVLRGDDGSKVGVFAPPEFTLFDELRTGDRVTFTYYESIVYQVKARHAARPRVSEEFAATESASKLPGGTLAHQITGTVTVEAVDREAPAITVVTADGRVVSRKLEDRSLLDGVKRGDRIDITYTEALLASVARAQ